MERIAIFDTIHSILILCSFFGAKNFNSYALISICFTKILLGPQKNESLNVTIY